MTDEVHIHCLNIGEFIPIQGKCQNLTCAHNSQSVQYGCLQVMIGRQSQPIDIQHYFRHDRKRKAQIMRAAEHKLACAGKIFRKVEEATLADLDFEKAFRTSWLIYPERRTWLEEAPALIKSLPPFFSYIRKDLWIDVFRRYHDELEKVGWITPAINRDMKRLFETLHGAAKATMQPLGDLKNG